MSEPRLIVAANRLPVAWDETEKSWSTSPGGLVAALAPVLEETDGIWVGWPGTANTDPGRFEVDDIEMFAVPLSKDELDSYYYGFCNGTIWPLYHDAIRPPEFHRHWWKPYQEVNRRFANAILEVAKPGDAIWIHDYQLQLVPEMIRSELPDARIGFFLHIPFPPPEIYGRLPWRAELLEGLLGADIVGFQTVSAARNFARSANHYTSATGNTDAIHFKERTITAETAPISIDTALFEKLAKDPDVALSGQQLLEDLGKPEVMILGVDRLDYSKGIDIRLRALDTLFSRHPELQEKVSFVQVAVPSREDVDAYQDTRRNIEEGVGRINGRFGTMEWTPVHYLYRTLDRKDLVALYREADVMLVTPLRDGMNLVAKEYVASRVGIGGVLVLSEFAGAAERLSQAVLVNPYDVDGLATGLLDAIHMHEDEAAERMSAMRSHLQRWDVHAWARYCLGRLGL
ncbi:MAG: trehalose-6-phosphate synthase [Acidimicrobiia bacterium]|nr:trehalose-6-phosphate synthase [Acidimicrobiia bacterium]